MKIENDMIDKELRAAGRMMKIINNTFTENRLRLMGKLKVKMRVKDREIQFVEQWIPREDGSKMRICIFKPLESKENVPGVLWLHGEGYALVHTMHVETILLLKSITRRFELSLQEDN